MRKSGRAKATSPDKPKAVPRDAGWNDSIALMLLSTANFWRRSGNAYYRNLFGISITEVAILSLLDARAPLTLNAIADHCGIVKCRQETVSEIAKDIGKSQYDSISNVRQPCQAGQRQILVGT